MIGAFRAFGLHVAQIIVVLELVTIRFGPHHETQLGSSGLALGFPLNTTCIGKSAGASTVTRSVVSVANCTMVFVLFCEVLPAPDSKFMP